MADFTAESLGSVTVRDFVALVKKTSDKEARQVLAGPDRQAILEEIFARFPAMFQPDSAEGVDARINFRVTGGPGDSSDTYAVVVKDGGCAVEKAPTAEPTVSLMMGPAEFLKIVTKSGNPVMMAMTGKLKVRGDLGLAQRFYDFFDVPKA